MSATVCTPVSYSLIPVNALLQSLLYICVCPVCILGIQTRTHASSGGASSHMYSQPVVVVVQPGDRAPGQEAGQQVWRAEWSKFGMGVHQGSPHSVHIYLTVLASASSGTQAKFIAKNQW